MRDPLTGEWLRFDDSLVIRNGYSQEVMSKAWERDGYLLWYAHSSCFQGE